MSSKILLLTLLLLSFSSGLALPQAGPSSTASPRWKAPVATVSDLPTYETAGTCRLALDTSTVFCTNGVTWYAAGSTAGGPWTLSGSTLYTSGTYNIGVNTTTPSSYLDVGGGVKTFIDGTNDILVKGDLEADGRIYGSFEAIATTLSGMSYTSTGSNDVYVQNNLEVDGKIYGDLSYQSANPSASIGLTANNGSAATYMRSDATPILSQAISPTWTGNHVFAPSSGNTVFSSGCVGIGTTVPSALLSVNKMGSAVSPFMVSSVGGGNGDYVVVTSSGNVGINTTVPANKLDVVGSLGLIGAGNTGIGTSSPNAKLSVKGSGTGTSATLNLKNSAETTTLTALDNGNMGINATSPGALLEVVNLAGTPLFKASSTSSTSGDYLAINSTGKVGIGTNNPGAILEINKKLLTTTTPLMVSSNGGTNGDYLLITSTGLVGVGSTSPAQTITINGSASFSIGTTGAGYIPCCKSAVGTNCLWGYCASISGNICNSCL